MTTKNFRMAIKNIMENLFCVFLQPIGKGLNGLEGLKGLKMKYGCIWSFAIAEGAYKKSSPKGDTCGSVLCTLHCFQRRHLPSYLFPHISYLFIFAAGDTGSPITHHPSLSANTKHHFFCEYKAQKIPHTLCRISSLSAASYPPGPPPAKYFRRL